MNVHVEELAIYHKKLYFPSFNSLWKPHGGIRNRKDLTAEQRRERADELIDEFNISHIRDSLGQSLSGGERRRVEIARA